MEVKKEEAGTLDFQGACLMPLCLERTHSSYYWRAFLQISGSRRPGWTWNSDSWVTTLSGMLVPKSRQIEHGGLNIVRQRHFQTAASRDCRKGTARMIPQREETPGWSVRWQRWRKTLLFAKAFNQWQQGQWTQWEGILPRWLGWSHLWNMPQARLSFLIRAMFIHGSIHPSHASKPGMLVWRREELHLVWLGNIHHSICGLGGVAIGGGMIKCCGSWQNMSGGYWLMRSQWRLFIQFVSAENTIQSLPPQSRTSALTRSKGWSMRAEVDKQLHFPTDITTTTLRPNIFLWLPMEKRVLLVELTVPWEEGD